MSMNKTNHSPDDALDGFFAAGKAQTPEPSEALMAAIMADAMAVADTFDAQSAPVRPGRLGLWATLLAVLGGWPAVAGMATAAVAGVWMGVTPPQGVSDWAGGVLLPAQASSLTTEESDFDLDEFVPGYGVMAVLDAEVMQ